MSLTVIVFPRKNRGFREGWRKKRQLRQIDANQRVTRETLAISACSVENVGPYCNFMSAVHNGPVQAVGNGLRLAPGTLADHAQAATFLPETLSGMELLEQLRARSARMVFVVDEYGVVQGLMTPQDLMEAITGELQPGQQADAWATLRPDGSWLLDGLMPVGELKARLELDADLPDEQRGRYNTVAGLLMAVSGHLPATGERIECAGWMFEVVDLDGRRIDKVLATRVEPQLL